MLSVVTARGSFVPAHEGLTLHNTSVTNLTTLLTLATSGEGRIIKVEPLARSAHGNLIGNEILRVTIQSRGVNPYTIILKTYPALDDERLSLGRRLGRRHQRLSEMLARYPSNNSGEREIKTYALLKNSINLRTPGFLGGAFDSDTGRTWLFLEDVSPFASLSASPPDNLRLIGLLSDMADFHAKNWNDTGALTGYHWVGNWWADNNSDYVSKEVALYLLDACRPFCEALQDRRFWRTIETALARREEVFRIFTERHQTLIHWDYGLHNIFASPGGNEHVIIDWETTSVGVAQWDVAELIFSAEREATHDTTVELLRTYISFLPERIQAELNLDDFIMVFDLVVFELLCRLSFPVLLSAEERGHEQTLSRQWANAVRWSLHRLGNTLAKLS